MCVRKPHHFLSSCETLKGSLNFSFYKRRQHVALGVALAGRGALNKCPGGCHSRDPPPASLPFLPLAFCSLHLPRRRLQFKCCLAPWVGTAWCCLADSAGTGKHTQTFGSVLASLVRGSGLPRAPARSQGAEWESQRVQNGAGLLEGLAERNGMWVPLPPPSLHRIPSVQTP